MIAPEFRRNKQIVTLDEAKFSTFWMTMEEAISLLATVCLIYAVEMETDQNRLVD